MTAQVVLLNGLGVALASDSAVTAGGKVMNSSEKIFDLPAPHKVAVLTSGRADFMGIPWEVALSAWSTTLDTPLQSLIEYRESVYKFLKTILPDSGTMADQEKAYLRSSYGGPSGVVAAVTKTLNETIYPHFADVLNTENFQLFLSDEPWEDEFRAEITSLLTEEAVGDFHSGLEDRARERQSEFQPVPGVKESLARVWIDKYWSTYERTPVEDFRNWPQIPGFDEAVSSLWSTFVVHADYEGETALNLLGFGAKDLFPSGAGVYMHGVVSGTLLKRFEGDAPSVAAPRYFFFGQSDAIENITSGEDRLLINTAVQTSKRTLSDIYDQISSLGVDELETTREYIKASLEMEGVAEEMRAAGDKERRQPFYRAIDIAPIHDLAEFAAQLVGVQAASAAMTQENPTVGGPVDVAVITHRGGFKWVRHAK